MDACAQALTPAKRSAQPKLAELIRPVPSEAQV
jgi:hypothetical protein